MIEVKCSVQTRKAIPSDTFLGFDSDNESNNIYFRINPFINGAAQVYIERDQDTGYIELEELTDSYYLPIKKALVKQVGTVLMQLLITTQDGKIYTFDKITFEVKSAIKTDQEMPEEYPTWMEVGNERLAELTEAINEANEVIEDANQAIVDINEVKDQILEDKEAGLFDGFSPIATVTETQSGATISITDLNGTTTANVLNGEKGEEGNGIDHIELYNTSGLTKTYRIFYTDGTHFDYVVNDGEDGIPGEPGADGEDGNGIENVELYSTSGNIKTYRMIFTDGTHFDFNVSDGEKGDNGNDAKINGINTLTIEAGSNVTLNQQNNTLTISATDTTYTAGDNITIENGVISASYEGTGDYTDLTNKPSINNVALSGNKSLADLGIKQSYTKADVGLNNVDNVQQYSVNNPPPYPVTSVNGQTGTVVIDTHDDLIPTQASSSNQLADKNFVNSSIATSTAIFRGTYNSLAELEQVTADENDYGFVVGTDTAGNTVYSRYKYASGTWVFEYALNNSSFTAAQWEAIQSGITDDLVNKLQGIEADAEVNIVEGLKIGNVTQQVSNKIMQINPDTTPTQGSTNVIDSNAVYELENMLPTDTTTGDIDNAQPYKVLDIVADGKYQQDTTEGNNIFHFESKTEDGWYTDIPNMITETGTYTLSINDNSLTGNWAVYFVDNNKIRVGDFIKSQSAVATPSTFSVSQEQVNAPYIRILPNASGLHDIGNYKFQINTGSTAKPYEPYTGGIPSPNPNFPQTITQVTSMTWNRVGKNLFDVNVIQERATNGITATITGQKINLSGTPTANANFYMKSGKSIKLKAGTYFITRSLMQNIATLKLQSGDTTIVATGSTDISFTLNEDTIIDGLTLQVPSTVGTINKNIVIQLEQGSTATPYSPYQGQSIPIDLDGNEVCSTSITPTDTIKDKLLVDRYGNVAIQKNVGKVLLNGSEYWTINTSTDTYYEFQAAVLNPSAISGYSFPKSSHFSSRADNRVVTNNNIALVRVPINNNITTAQQFKTWLSNNNVTVYYALATPTIIPLPKLSILPSTLKGINHIWVDTNLGRTDIEVEYVKDLSLAIPTKTSELTNDSGYVKNTDYATTTTAGVIKTSGTFGTYLSDGALVAAQRTYAQYTNANVGLIVSKGTLENVITGKGLSTFSGSYNDLTDKPTIPDELADLTDDSTHRTVTDTEKNTWNAKSDFSGSYADLTNKPTIPDELADLTDDSTHRVVTDTEKSTWSGKQDALVSGTNIKTINNESILGSGNITIQGGGGSVTTDGVTINTNTSDELQTIAVIDDNAGAAIKTWKGTLAQYNAIQNKDNSTIYYITDDSIDISNDMYKMYTTTGKTAPTIYNSRASNLVGGYEISNGYCYYNMSFTLPSTLSASYYDGGASIFLDMPKPATQNSGISTVVNTSNEMIIGCGCSILIDNNNTGKLLLTFLRDVTANSTAMIQGMYKLA